MSLFCWLVIVRGRRCIDTKSQATKETIPEGLLGLHDEVIGVLYVILSLVLSGREDSTNELMVLHLINLLNGLVGCYVNQLRARSVCLVLYMFCLHINFVVCSNQMFEQQKYKQFSESPSVSKEFFCKIYKVYPEYLQRKLFKIWRYRK